MRILLVTEYFPKGKDLRFSGGVEARTYFVGKQLAKNHEVIVLCTRQPHTKAKETISGMRILRVGPILDYNAGSGKINPIKLIGFLVSAMREGVRLNADIVDGGNFISHFIAKIISLNTKKPVLYWYPDVFIGNWIKTSGLLSGFMGWACEKLNLKMGANKFIAISNTTKQKLAEQGIPKNKIVVITCGIAKSEFASRKVKKDITIINIGRLVAYKRTADLIWAFAALRKQRITAKLLVIGQGPEENNLKNLIKMLKLTKEAQIIGNLRRNDLIEKIKLATIFCLPSEIEGFGISTIEAAAAGVPYVVSDIPVFREITKNGKGGLLFKTGNILDLTNQLEKLLTNKKLYSKNQKEALELAKNYDWDTVVSQTEKLYKEIAKNT